MPVDTQTDPILQDILDFCALHGMAPSRFGLEAVGDRALVHTLQEGREVRRKTRDRIRDYMRSASTEPSKRCA